MALFGNKSCMLLFHCTKDAIEALTATHQGKTHWVDNASLPEGRSHGAGSCTR